MDQGLTRDLAQLLTDISARAIDATVLDAAKGRLLHALRVSLAGSDLPPAAVARRALRDYRGDCLVIGSSRGLPEAEAAFVNGVIGHSSLQEDCGPGGLREGSHPATYIIPAALAAAEATNASGMRLLTGIVTGYEAVSRIGAAAPPEIVGRRFRPVGVMGPFGAAAAAAHVLGCSAEQMASALDIASNMSGGSTQGIYDGTMEPYFQAGTAARDGLLGARLAAAGAVTSARSLEGEFGFFATYGGAEPPTEELLAMREDLAVERVGTKRFPACLQNQETMALIVDGLPRPLSAEEIERVVLTRPAVGTNGLNSPGVSRHGPFHNMLHAQMSARFTAAASLTGKPVEQPYYFQGGYNDPVMTSLSERIDLISREQEDITVEIYLAAGDPIVLRSSGSNVLSPGVGEVRQRFLRVATPLLGDRAEQVLTIIDGMEQEAHVRNLTTLLRQAADESPRVPDPSSWLATD
jgi:2-methylcitrate dehydratase PrpD